MPSSSFCVARLYAPDTRSIALSYHAARFAIACSMSPCDVSIAPSSDALHRAVLEVEHVRARELEREHGGGGTARRAARPRAARRDVQQRDREVPRRDVRWQVAAARERCRAARRAPRYDTRRSTARRSADACTRSARCRPRAGRAAARGSRARGTLRATCSQLSMPLTYRRADHADEQEDEDDPDRDFEDPRPEHDGSCPRSAVTALRTRHGLGCRLGCRLCCRRRHRRRWRVTSPEEEVRPREEVLPVRRVGVAAVVLPPREVAVEQADVHRRHLLLRVVVGRRRGPFAPSRRNTGRAATVAM